MPTTTTTTTWQLDLKLQECESDHLSEVNEKNTFVFQLKTQQIRNYILTSIQLLETVFVVIMYLLRF